MTTTPQFRMIDVGRKRTTRRRAIATGTITVGEQVFALIRDKALPKGDVLSLAEVAAITGAKKTPELLLMCHPLPIDAVSLHCVAEAPDRIRVYCQVAAHAKTGVEMEAIMGVQAALATIWDLSKGTEPNLAIGDIRLLLKEGGKTGLWVNPDGLPDWLAAQLPSTTPLAGVTAAVLIASDRAAAGEYADRSGPLLVEKLTQAGASTLPIRVVADGRAALESHILALCEGKRPQLLVLSGGTGAGARDNTPDAVTTLCHKMLDGFGEHLRTESAAITDMAWLSRACAGICHETLVLSLPGNPKAAAECWDILLPLLPHTLHTLRGGHHG